MFDFHITPEHIVASIIKKHIPRTAKSLLDPSVGSGALVRDLPKRIEKITCMDIDRNLLSDLHVNFPSNSDLVIECDDFLNNNFKNAKFDCVVCNPPFNNTKNYTIDGKKAPIEAAFLHKIIELLSDNGRAIVVLPSSITKGIRLRWLRREILKTSRLTYSYKLPKFTFSKIEGDFSIVILDKASRQRKSRFLTSQGDKIELNATENILNETFDADEVSSIISRNLLLEHTPFQLSKLGSVYEITRGTVTENFKDGTALHTTNYLEESRIPYEANSDIALYKGDLVLKRVARNPLGSLREYTGSQVRFTECIFRLRTKNVQKRLQLLFGLHVSFCFSFTNNLLIKGSGASYLTKSGLTDFSFFTDVFEYFKSEFREYKEGDYEARCNIAKRVAFLIENKDWSNTEKLDNNSKTLNDSVLRRLQCAS